MIFRQFTHSPEFRKKGGNCVAANFVVCFVCVYAAVATRCVVCDLSHDGSSCTTTTRVTTTCCSNAVRLVSLIHHYLLAAGIITALTLVGPSL